MSLPAEVLAQLQTEYLDSFKEKYSELSNACENKTWSVLESNFHKFAGSGSTYDMPEITDFARHIEDYLKANKRPQPVVVRRAVDEFFKIIEARRNGTVYEAYPRFFKMA